MCAIKKFVCLLGLPRSGTTVVTAAIDAHASVEMFYEPWNSSKKNLPAVYENPEEFQRAMAKKVGIRSKIDAEAVGFKETSQHQEALEWSKLTLRQMEKHCECLLLFLARDPLQAYLSRVEGARKYWNWPNAQATEEGYRNYVEEAIKAYRTIGAMAHDHKTMVLSYDAFVEGPENILPRIMEFIGLKFEESQLRFYEKQTERNKIMGDPEVAKTPRKVSAGFMLKRMAEAEKFKKTFRLDCWATPEMRELESWGQRIKREKITTENILEQSFFPPKS